jgi:hypothetical protein
MSNKLFKAAAVAVDITPDLDSYDIRLHGYGARGSKMAEGIHDPLFGKILVLEQGDALAVIITLDNLQIDGLLLDAVAARADIPGITVESLAVCASHTHSAPAALQKRNQNMTSGLRWYQPSYYEFCVDELARGLNEAVSKLQPARYAMRKTHVGTLVRNRRVPSYDYDTRGFSAPVETDVAVDDEMIVLQFATDKDELIATLVNLAAHGTVLGADNMLISADWAGYMQASIEESCGGVCMYANGAEGNLAPDCGAGPLGFAEAEGFGRAVASRVLELVVDTDFRRPATLGIYAAQVDLPDYQIPNESPFLQAGLGRDFVENFVHETYPRQIQQSLLRLDDVAMLTIPGEMFTELSIDFKQRAREKGIGTPLVLGLANDSIGYMVTADEYGKEGYETGMCLYGPELGVALVNEGLNNLGQLFPLT